MESTPTPATRKLSKLARVAHRALTFVLGEPEVFMHDAEHLHYARWCLWRGSDGRKVYLHHFVNGDGRPHPHDHPKEFTSIGLLGSYVEETYCGHPVCAATRYCKTFAAPWKRTFQPTYIHRIADVKASCWTLVITSEFKREWGFFVPNPDEESVGLWVPHDEYIFQQGAIKRVDTNS